MKKFNKFLIVSVVVCLVLSLSVMMFGCKDKDKPADDTDISFVTMDINPSIEFVLDENNMVVDVIAANSDASIIIDNTDNLKGLSIEAASKKVIDSAIDFKYISKEDAKTVSLDVSCANAVKASAIFDETSASIKAELDLNEIASSVEKGVDFMAEKELATVKAHKTGVKGYDDSLTVAKYRLVKRAMLANVTMTMDEAVLKDENELIKMIDYAKDKVQYAYDTVTAEAIRVATATYNNTKEGLLRAVYLAPYAPLVNTKYLVEDTKKSLALEYNALALATVTTEEVTFAVRKALDAIEIPVAPVKTALTNAGVSDEDVAKLDKYAENGNITKNSLYAFINDLYRNMDKAAREAFETTYTTSFEAVNDKIELQTNSAINAKAGKFTSALKFKGEGFDISADVDIDLPDFEAKQVTIDDIDTIISKLHKATDAKYEEMMNGLNDEGKEFVKTTQDNINDKLSNAEKKLDNAVKDANEKAKAAVKALAEKRKIELELNVTIK